ncbi:MAG TPA: putative glycolipid-binding domain-containing protein [Terriglobales bacterium]|nr:putative glycolipid-binding domain-containing protein [Terriglobales bacterium]
MIVARWRDASGRGLEHCVVREEADGIVADAVVIGGDESFGVRYRVTCDTAWRVRALTVQLVGGASAVNLVGDGAGAWWSDRSASMFDARPGSAASARVGTARPDLAGAIDVDIAATPFTNTLPIRRLGLREGEAAEIVVAYVAVPELTVAPAPQRYTRLSERRYRFESRDGGFTREIDVDEHGLVVHYPGLFERTA